MANPIPVHDESFYHDGRGPELQRVVWSHKGAILSGFEYFNPDDAYTPENLKHLKLEYVEAYTMAGEEVHGRIFANGKTRASIFRVDKSDWKDTFKQRHLTECHHFQIMFYDEIFDIICRNISFGSGRLQPKQKDGEQVGDGDAEEAV